MDVRAFHAGRQHAQRLATLTVHGDADLAAETTAEILSDPNIAWGTLNAFGVIMKAAVEIMSDMGGRPQAEILPIFFRHFEAAMEYWDLIPDTETGGSTDANA